MADSSQSVGGTITPTGDIPLFVIEADNPEGFLFPFGSLVAEAMQQISPGQGFALEGVLAFTGVLTTALLGSCYPAAYTCVESVPTDYDCADVCVVQVDNPSIELGGTITPVGSLGMEGHIALGGVLGMSGAFVQPPCILYPNHTGVLLNGYADIAAMFSDGFILLDPDGIITLSLVSSPQITGKSLKVSATGGAGTHSWAFYKPLSGFAANQLLDASFSQYPETPSYAWNTPVGEWTELLAPFNASGAGVANVGVVGSFVFGGPTGPIVAYFDRMRLSTPACVINGHMLDTEP